MSSKNLHDAKRIIQRVKRACGIKKTKDLAVVLGVRPSTISSWINRGKVDLNLILAKCKHLDPVLLFQEEMDNEQECVKDTGRPDIRYVVEPESGRITPVTGDELCSIHMLIHILRHADKETVEAIRGNLKMAFRLCGYISGRLGDMIILERRVRQLPKELWPEGVTRDRRKTAAGQ